MEVHASESGKLYVTRYTNLKNKNSTGHDKISPQHIKDSLIVTLEFIATIINTSIVTQTFPRLMETVTSSS